MNIFGVGLPEVTVILVLALIIFGPKKLPELGKQLGKTLKSLKIASNEFQNEIEKVINQPDTNITKKETSPFKEGNKISTGPKSNSNEAKDTYSTEIETKEDEEKNE